MSFGGLVKNVIKELNSLGLEYAFTGALAVSYYGRPRTTVDVDVIIRATEDQFDDLALALRKARLDCEVKALRAAWESKYRIASFRDRQGLVLDVILTQEDIPRRRATILGLPAWVQAPGPLVLQKLRLMKVTQDAEKRVIDKLDVLSILKNLEMGGDDVETLKDQARQQATFDILQDLLSEAEVS